MLISPLDSEPQPLIVFRLDDNRYGLRADAVERVVRTVEITPLPKALPTILGVINAEGQVIPVFDMRRRFQLAERTAALSDHLIIAHAGERKVALAVDEALDVLVPAASALVPPDEIIAGLEYVQGVVRLDDGLLFIHDLEAFLSPSESAALDEALAAPATPKPKNPE